MKKECLKKLAEKAQGYVQYETPRALTWCSGCGNFGIQNAMKRAFALEGIGRKDSLMCFDVGCCGNGSDKIEGYTIHGLHGRVISLAAGAKLVNPKLNVVAVGGDGGTFSEGVNHLVHAVRNDYPVVFVLHNNENYGLTTGQPSALTRKGVKMRNSAPLGVEVNELNAAQFVLSLKPSFVARTYSGDVDQMTEVFREALNHNGFAFVEVLQSCPTYNRETPDHWYGERVKDVADLEGYDRGDIWAARKICEDMDNEIYTGVLYKNDRGGFKGAVKGEVKHYGVGELY